MTTIHWAFAEKDVEIEEIVGDRVAYSWTCGDRTHSHRIDCLWVWHYCTLELDPEQIENSRRLGIPVSLGWRPSGVGLHDLISETPLHVEASIYWPACCGLHGWIRDGKWIDA